MDHSENDRRFYVYVHKDDNMDIVYVGSGSALRMHKSSGRTKNHIDIFENLTKEVVKDNLTKEEALNLEIELYNKYVTTGKLLNKNKPSKVLPICYEHISKIIYYDETSPTFIRWACDIYGGTNKKQVIRKQGSVAGTRSGNGYFLVSISKVKYLVHRIVYCLASKENVPTNLVVDHINNNRSDNSVHNLRLVTYCENSLNRLSCKPADMKCLTIRKDGSVVLITTINLKSYNKTFNPVILFGDDPNKEQKTLFWQKSIET